MPGDLGQCRCHCPRIPPGRLCAHALCAVPSLSAFRHRLGTHSMCLGMRRNVQALHITNALALSCSNHPRVLLISQKPTSDALLCDVSVGSKPEVIPLERHVRSTSMNEPASQERAARGAGGGDGVTR